MQEPVSNVVPTIPDRALARAVADPLHVAQRSRSSECVKLQPKRISLCARDLLALRVAVAICEFKCELG